MEENQDPEGQNDAARQDNGKQSFSTSILNHHGCFMSDGKRRIDFVMAYVLGGGHRHHSAAVVENSDSEKRRHYFLDNVLKEGLELESEEVHDSKEVILFIKVHVPFETLCKWAHALKMEMPLKIKDENRRHAVEERGSLYTWWQKLFNFYHFSSIGRENFDVLATDEKVYHPFDDKDLEKFDIETTTEREKFFPDRFRQEIAWEALQQARNDPEDEKLRGIEALVEEKIFETAYPVHDAVHELLNHDGKARNLRHTLSHEWANWRSLGYQQPLIRIRDYFGEKIGFYFVFMDYYTKMLSIPSILGLIVFVESLWSVKNDDELRNVCDENATPGNFWMCPICHPPYCEAWEMYKEGCRKYKWEFSLDNEGTLTLSCLVTLWAILFLKFWKRRESTMAGQFNTLRFRSRHSGMRPDYEIRSTTVQKNPVTGELEPHVPLRLRIIWHSVSILCTICILATAGLCLVGLVVSRIALYAVFHKMGGHLAKHNIEASRWFTHGLIFLLIAVFEGIYKFLVGKLTKYECPRTPHEFMNNMLWKLFVFELLIDFVPICYAAWLKGRTVQTPLNLNWLTELCDAGCTSEVVELVFVLLFLRLIVGNFLEIAVPFFRHCFRKFQHTRRTSHRNLPQWLKDYYLNEVELDGVFEDYMEMMVQFAFVVLFPPVFPLAALICLVNNIFEIRVDAIKMLKTNRKPLPLRASGIHIWNTFMDVIVKLGIIFNAGLIAFTSEVIPRLYYTYHRATDIHRRHIGYLEYSLSYIHVKDWEDEAKIEEMTTKNITKCYYMGYREPDYPYPHKHDYWRIVTVRLTAFTVYSIGFFVLMYLVNLMIDDTPSSVRARLDRHKFLVTKHLDQERRQAREAVRRVKRVHPSLLIRSSIVGPHNDYDQILKCQVYCTVSTMVIEKFSQCRPFQVISGD